MIQEKTKLNSNIERYSVIEPLDQEVDWHFEILEERINKKDKEYFTYEQVLERLAKL